MNFKNTEKLLNQKFADNDFDSYCVLVYAKGYERFIHSPNVNADTYFDIASMGKVLVTSPLILKAVGENKLSLDDTPAHFFDNTPKDKAFITMKQLLTHTSGIRRYDIPQEIADKGNDNEIIAVMCGGILMGAGVGMIVKVGASTGGSDFAGLILKKFLPHISLAKLIMFIDCFIVIISGIIFKSFSVTFYSITALFVSSIIIDKIMTFGESAKMILIFSENIKEISEHILQKFERGVTGIHSLGMYSNRESLMLLCVITPKELPVYISMIKEIDKNAFVIINNVHEVLGEGFKAIDINC